MTRRAGLVTAVAVAALVAVGAVLAANDREGSRADAVVYVAVGASDAVGVGAETPARDAWPVVFLQASLPPRTRFENVAVPGATVSEALAEQVPRAVAAAPDLVTVWLGVNDLRAFVGADTYQTQLEQLVRALRRGGGTDVLVANIPELDELPVFERLPIPSAVIEARVAAYNRAVAAVAASTGAVVVDLHARSERFEEERRIASLTAADGFHPNTAGHREIARAFSAAYRRLP